MSTVAAAGTGSAGGGAMGSERRLWTQQLAAIFHLELRRALLGPRTIILYLLALSPVPLDILVAMFLGGFRLLDIHKTYAEVYQGLHLHLLFFFGSVWLFTNLFRGEVLERSLHYYFLAPVRRSLLVLGKYLAGVATAVLVFELSTVLTLLAFHWGQRSEVVLHAVLGATGLKSLLAYMGVTFLACVGYGAVFLVMGLVFKNPALPAVALWGWEFINFLLPPLLKKLSVVHYLQALCPVQISNGPFALLADPTPPFVALVSLLVLSAALLAYARLRVRKMEINYGMD